MRQDLAISFVLLGYMGLLKGNKRSFFIWVFLASLFHYSAIVSLVVFYVYKKWRLSFYKMIILMLLSLASSFLLTSNVLGLVLGPYAGYIQDGEGFRGNMLSAYILGFLANILYVVIYKTSLNSFRNSLFMKIYFMGIILMNITTQLELGTRIILYFTVLQIIVLPLYMQKNLFKNKYVAIALASTYALVLFFKYLVGDPLEICPYKLYFI